MNDCDRDDDDDREESVPVEIDENGYILGQCANCGCKCRERDTLCDDCFKAIYRD